MSKIWSLTLPRLLRWTRNSNCGFGVIMKKLVVGGVWRFAPVLALAGSYTPQRPTRAGILRAPVAQCTTEREFGHAYHYRERG